MDLIKNYLEDFSNVKMWDEVYREKLLEKIKLYTPSIASLTQAQDNHLKEIFITLQSVDNALQTFREKRLTYNLSLVGGSVRDYVLNQPEKSADFDIVINFPSILDKHNPNNKESIAPEHSGAWQSLIEEFKIEQYEDETKTYSNVVQAVLKQSFKNMTTYYNHDNIIKDYLNGEINAIFKITDNKFIKPVDLIFSRYDPKIFITSFDFEICKCKIDYRRAHVPSSGETDYRNDIRLIDGAQNTDNNAHHCLINETMLFPGFIKDMENQTLSINTSRFSQNHIEYFMSKHYVKLKEKLPEYKLNFFAPKIREDDHRCEFSFDYLESNFKILAQMLLLDEKLPPAKNMKEKKLKI